MKVQVRLPLMIGREIKSIIRSGVKKMNTKEYIYIFVRQDLSNEQQLVQAAHVTLVLGNQLRDYKVDDLYFAVIGVPDIKGLVKAAHDLGDRQYVKFYEPDQGNTITAIATFPIKDQDRGELLKYKKLQLKNCAIHFDLNVV
jgi:hypothetical protein